VIVGDASTGRVVLWNRAAASMFGYDQDEGAGLLIEELVAPEMRSAHREGMARLARGEPTPLLDSESAVELLACRRDGSSLWVELRLAHISGPEQGRFALAIIRDITIRREAEEAREAALRELRSLRAELEQRNRDLDLVARTDHLTGLWNRRHVEEHLAMAISSAPATSAHSRCCCLMSTGSRVSTVRFGHEAGDRTLQEVAARLKGHVRTEDTLGRWGGEEFVVVLPEISAELAISAAERLRRAIAADQIVVGQHSISVTVSIGVAGGESPEHDLLLAQADAALSRAKTAGKNRSST
jgi:diguanylate cyclase (GGDEF)-like protein/PAS domain S-box-containing protein